MIKRIILGGASCPVMGAVFKTVSGCARAYLGGFDSHTPPPVLKGERRKVKGGSNGRLARFFLLGISFILSPLSL